MLAKSPERITLKDILDTLEGNCALVDCVHDQKACKRSSTCVTREIWQEVNNRFSEALASVTLAHIIAKSKKYTDQKTLSYII